MSRPTPRRHEGGQVVSLRRAGAGEELSDPALLAACAVGDQAALAALFRRHHHRLHAFCHRLVPAAEVDDLVQNTFVAAWAQAGRFRGQATVGAWLLAIAANLARKSRRGHERRRAALALLGLTPALPGDADERLAARQLLSRLEQALERLPHDLRVAFLLCEVEGIAGTEASRALGVRPGTLWRRLHDARKRLLFLLEGEES